MTLKEKLRACSQSRTALLAVNFYNFETIKGLLLAAQSTGNPLILQLSEGSIQYLGLNPAVAMARAMLKEYGVEGWIHLDHGNRIELVKACLDAGFDSVMIDASEKSFEDCVSFEPCAPAFSARRWSRTIRAARCFFMVG